MDIINIKKNNQIIMTVGMKYTLGYDNYQWFKLDRLIKILLEGKKPSEENGYYILDKEDSKYAEATIDLDNKTVTNTYTFPLYEFDEVNKDNCCIDLIKKGDEYYAYYEDSDESILMPHVTYKDESLLRRKTGLYTFEEVNKLANFVDELMGGEELTDFIYNNSAVIRLNII